MSFGIPVQTKDGNISLLEFNQATSGDEYAIRVQTADGKESLMQVNPADSGDQYAIPAQTADGKIVLVTPIVYLGQKVIAESGAADDWIELWDETRNGLVEPSFEIVGVQDKIPTNTTTIANQTRYRCDNSGGKITRIIRSLGKFSTAGIGNNIEANIYTTNDIGVSFGSYDPQDVDMHLIMYDGFLSVGSDWVDKGTIIHTWTIPGDSFGEIENVDLSSYMPRSNFYLACVSVKDYNDTLDYRGPPDSPQVDFVSATIKLQELGSSSSSSSPLKSSSSTSSTSSGSSNSSSSS